MATFNDVNTFTELQNAINTANSNSEADIINLTGNITLSNALPLINEGNSLTINGGNFTISGSSQHRIFFVRSGTVNFNNLTLTNGRALGGNGGNGGGGGAGMGGALFIYDGSVSVSNSTFSSNQAIGGNGGGWYL